MTFCQRDTADMFYKVATSHQNSHLLIGLSLFAYYKMQPYISIRGFILIELGLHIFKF